MHRSCFSQNCCFCSKFCRQWQRRPSERSV